MSYCRWSSDNFHCDLYCYQSDQGYVTHVARTRITSYLPKPSSSKWITKIPLRLGWPIWWLRLWYWNWWMEKATRTPIDLPHDGENFLNEDLDGFLRTLLHLRRAGYRFPAHVIEAVLEELVEENVP